MFPNFLFGKFDVDKGIACSEQLAFNVIEIIELVEIEGIERRAQTIRDGEIKYELIDTPELGKRHAVAEEHANDVVGRVHDEGLIWLDSHAE